MRLELIGELAAAQLAVEAAIQTVLASGANNASATELRSKLSGLIGLRQTIGAADSGSLAQLRGQVAATANAAVATADQAVGGSAASNSGQTMNAQQARQAIAEVGRKLFDDKVLDPYLQFTSPEDEAEYRRREEERRKAYERELAKGTEEGDRRAAEIERAQLADAKAHGADRSPDFAPMMKASEEASATLATIAAGKPTKEKLAAPAATKDDLPDVMAALREAGVKTDEPPAAGSGHGLGDKVAARDAKGAVRST